MIDKWPTPIKFAKWKMDLFDEVAAASAEPSGAIKWVLEARSRTFSDLASTESLDGTDFETLDAKLASSLIRLAPLSFEKTLRAKRTEAYSAGHRVTGRQILLLIDEHFSMSIADGAIYDQEHLLAVSIRNDDLAGCVTQWENVLAGM